MVRRSTNAFAAMQRRLPHKALLHREGPFRRVDSEELETACRRFADGALGRAVFAGFARFYFDDYQSFDLVFYNEFVKNFVSIVEWVNPMLVDL